METLKHSNFGYYLRVRREDGITFAIKLVSGRFLTNVKEKYNMQSKIIIFICFHI